MAELSVRHGEFTVDPARNIQLYFHSATLQGLLEILPSVGPFDRAF